MTRNKNSATPKGTRAPARSAPATPAATAGAVAQPTSSVPSDAPISSGSASVDGNATAPKTSSAPKTPAAVKQEKCIWHDKDDECLLRVLEEAKRNGENGEGGFKTQTYQKAAIELEKILTVGGPKTVTRVTDHFKNLKKAWKEVKFLISQSGFGWDSEQNRVTASPEVWDALIKTHPEYKKWKRMTLWYYDRMDDLCAESTATGDYVLNPSKPPAAAAAASGEDEFEDVDEDEDEGQEAGDGSSPEKFYEDWPDSDIEENGKGKAKRGAADSSGAGPRKKSKFSAVEEIASVSKSVGRLVSLEKERMRMEQAEVDASSSSTSETTSLAALMQQETDNFTGAELGTIAFAVTKTPALLSTWISLSQLPEIRLAFLQEILGNSKM
ncbi:hypothetical protein CF327_g7068 [Tilletia walkeri]|uniref:Myb/SANT-like domain-containing protein n=1 Tax=Tilletia walkeri TaxID=117179 RepID=A0A8X7N3Q6_9BASI|nr:hypothetical protein CF327_g7068 [Tilletia walkeri]KAE8265924.1 hypothetical protein A4X09_0g6425 [Tilletia walkeri]